MSALTRLVVSRKAVECIYIIAGIGSRTTSISRIETIHFSYHIIDIVVCTTCFELQLVGLG